MKKKKKHFYLSSEVKDPTTEDGTDVGVIVDMFANKKTAAVIAKGLGAVLADALLSEEEEG